MKSICLFFISVVFLTGFFTYSPVFATEYHIGSGQPYPTINSFASHWLTLQPGDHVYIHPGTYREMIFLHTSGTEAQPIIVEGVLDGNGNKPIISGDNMVIAPEYDSHLTHYDPDGNGMYQGMGALFIEKSQVGDDFRYAPAWIQIKNLDFRETTPESYTFTNTRGVVQSYRNANAGIYIRNGKNILIENCDIHDTGNGIELQGVDTMAHNITIRGCRIWNFGRTDGRFNLEHGLYIESAGFTLEYSIVGPIRANAGGSAIKLRGADEVIRYNVIYSGARTLDLVEPENQSGSTSCGGPIVSDGMRGEPGFLDTWVYGNTFINGPKETYNSISGRMFHYGADNCPAVSRSGTLHFYNNTTILDIPSSDQYYTRIFQPTSSRETIELYNNVFMSLQNTQLYVGTEAGGTYNWNGGNWITTPYTDLRSGSTAIWNENATILEGGNAGVLVNPHGGDFSVPAGSPLINAGVNLPGLITSDHAVTVAYVDPRTYQFRADTDDIGAFMYGGGGGVPSCSDGIQNQDETGIDCGGMCPACTSGVIVAPLLHPAVSN